MQRAIAWQQAWERAAQSFYRQQEPGRHFTTDAMDGSSLSLVLPRLRQVLDDCPGPITVVDVGAGDGGLLRGLHAALRERPDAERTRLVGIDLRGRPQALDPGIEWRSGDARSTELEPFDGLLIAHEFLDDLPCPWIECDADGNPRVVLVDDHGETQLGPALADRAHCRRLGVEAAAIEDWIQAWWPIRRPFARCEPGLDRDRAWARLTKAVRTGQAIAIDYGHVRQQRAAGTWDGGTITGYRTGRVVSPIPDGSCNITAHVSMDAIAAATSDAIASTLQPLHGDFWLLAQAFGSGSGRHAARGPAAGVGTATMPR